ncbi:MAG: virulence protein [Oscillospiraceae bacterium]|nr:virulence protein [Oscillospiraceae bacterium]
MKIRISLNNHKRKDLALAVGELLNAPPEYKRNPNHIYHIGKVEIDRESTLTFPPDTNPAIIKQLSDELQTKGFTAELPDKLVIQMPLEGFDEVAIENLRKLVNAKANLIKKALAVEDLPIEQTENTLDFAWFAFDTPSEDVTAYSQFISALCDMAKKQKRVLATEKSVENEKYAFRCFLLRLGFIGDEYADTRKALLRNLTGNGSWKSEAAAGERAKPAPSSSKIEESAEAIGKHLLRGFVQYLETIL